MLHFPSNKIVFTKSDYRLLGAYFLIMLTWLTYRFHAEGYVGDEIVIDLLNQVYKVGSSFYLFKLLMERFVLQSRRYFLALLLLLLGLALIGGTNNIIGTWSGGDDIAEMLFPLSRFVINGLNSALLDLTGIIGLLFAKKFYDQQIRNRDLQIVNRENSLKILRNQFSPHFLFNNLNTIDALVDEQPAVAKAYIAHLASLYRYLTETINEDLVHLEREVEFIKSYLFLLDIRFGNDFLFELKEAPAGQGFFLPTGALQIAIENVVKHNAPGEKPIKTILEFTDEAIRITNTKAAKVVVASPGTGLSNLKERYTLLDQPTPEIVDTNTHFVLVLPLIKPQVD